MKQNGVVTNDLYGFALTRLAEIQQPANVHFTPSGSDMLAKEVAAAIERILVEK
jgi:acyl-CoA thioesterase-1